MREGGHGWSKLAADTWLAEGALLDELGRRKELTVEWPGMIIFSATMEYHWCEKSGRGVAQRYFFEVGARLATNWKPPSGV